MSPKAAETSLDFLCVGLNHETSPLEIRDALVMNDAEVERAIRVLRDRGGAEEAMILSTCNRTEVYARGAAVTDLPLFVNDLLREIKGMDLGARGHRLYAYREPDSVRHLFQVACGLNSQVLGEPQIVGQVKDALALAARSGGSGPVTERLLDAALRCAKRARTETGIGRGPISSVYAAVSLASKVLGHLGEKRALIVGSGEMAGLALCHLVDAGVGQFTIAARNRERAEMLAREVGARIVSLEAIPVVLPGADIVVCATAAPGYVILEEAVRGAMKIRKNRPLLLLDLAVPRDVDPAVAKLPNVFLHDLDALAAIVAQSLEQRRAEAPKVEAIIDDELRRFMRWYRSLELKPTVTAFRGHFERIAQEELERHRGRFRPEDQPALESLTRAIVQKLLHRPTTRLNRAGEDGGTGLRRIDAVRELFGVGGEEETDEDRDAR
ncbi:MAG TPA: glutamyl-tRNA reductase [Candidatus Limnocylindrales bacterium]|nr:glutamyl-tRNA reductase [Candidatus Limnocylindrales bacterium]